MNNNKCKFCGKTIETDVFTIKGYGDFHLDCHRIIEIGRKYKNLDERIAKIIKEIDKY